MKALLISNPVAGKMQIKNKYKEIGKLFKKHGIAVDVKETKHCGDAVGITQKYASKYDVFICCGGDGTLNEVVTGMIMSKCDKPIGYIPSGTTNDFAKTIGISLNPIQAVNDIINGKQERVDVGKINDKFFLYVASFGAFTKSSYKTTQNAKNTFGHFAYILEGVKEIPQIKPYNVSLTDDCNNEYNDDYFIGLISNATSIGGIIKLDKDKVNISDGKFEVMLIKFPKNIIEFNKIIFSLQNNNFEDDMISFFHTSKLSISGTEMLDLAIDGEYVCGKNNIIIENIPQAVSIILPRKK